MATKTIYLCIFNPETREIEGAEEYTDSKLAEVRYSMYQVECVARGDKGPWTPYWSDEKPFAFEEVKE